MRFQQYNYNYSGSIPEYVIYVYVYLTAF